MWMSSLVFDSVSYGFLKNHLAVLPPWEPSCCFSPISYWELSNFKRVVSASWQIALGLIISVFSLWPGPLSHRLSMWHPRFPLGQICVYFLHQRAVVGSEFVLGFASVSDVPAVVVIYFWCPSGSGHQECSRTPSPQLQAGVILLS